MGNLSAIFAKLITDLGARADAASATGSLHAKVKDIKDNPPSVINSIQRGTTGSAGATITSVNTAKSSLAHLGGSAPTDNYQHICQIALASATSVTVATISTATVSWEVVEYK